MTKQLSENNYADNSRLVLKWFRIATAKARILERDVVGVDYYARE